jgi:hypothetical protein
MLISDEIKTSHLRTMDGMLGIIEIFSNISAYGETAEQFRDILNNAGILEQCLILLRNLKQVVDIMIEHKIYE